MVKLKGKNYVIGKKAWKFKGKLKEGKGRRFSEKLFEGGRKKETYDDRTSEKGRRFFRDSGGEVTGVNNQELEKRGKRKRNTILKRWYKMIKKSGV